MSSPRIERRRLTWTGHPVALGALTLASALACSETPPPAQAPQAEPSAHTAEPAPADARYGALPAATPAPDWAPPAQARFTLSNGIRVQHLERGPTPLVAVELIVPRGAATDPQGKAGLTYLLADMLDEGAGRYDALQLSEELGLLATDYGASAGVDYVRLGMNLLADNFETSIDLLGDIVRRPRLPKAEFDRRKAHFIAQAIAREAEPRAALSVAVHSAVFGAGYASAPAQGTRVSLESLSYADLQRHHRALLAPDAVEIVVVGGLDRARVQKALEATFGDWKGQSKTENQPVAPEVETHPIYFIDYPKATQTALAVVQRTPGADSATYFQDLVYNWNLGEAFTSRINLNLREDKGYTYGARSDFRRYKDSGYFAVVANVREDATRASIDEIFKELTDACGARPLTAGERDAAVNGLLLGYPAEFTRVDDVALRFATLPMYGRPDDFWQRWPAAVEAVSVQQANASAAQHCSPESFSIVLAGDLEKVRPTLESLGRPLQLLDRQGLPVSPSAAPPK